MKIGILTLQIHRNYGGTLQNFALQKVLQEMGYDPITINRRPPRNKVRYWLSQIKYYLYKVLSRDVSGVFYFQHHKMGQKFYRFVKKHLRLTIPVNNYSIDILKKYNCDIVIVGSDQVWRRGFFPPDFIRNYFCEFIGNDHIPRIAYAASFGVDEWEYEEDLGKDCAELASRFIAISTREDSGVELLKNLGVNNAKAVLDPTMLLTAKDYCKISDNVPSNKSSFLFAYLLNCSEYNITIVNQIAKRHNLTPLIVRSEFDAQYSVEEWIALIRDCNYVVTDSFHGTVFSILFHKPFATLINTKRGEGRLNTLLSRFDLRDRMIYDEIEFPAKAIDWSTVDLKLNAWRKISYNFLEKSLAQAQSIINQPSNS